MKLSRRGFLKLSAAAALSTAFGGIGFALKPAAADRIAMLKPDWSKQTTTACCYCAVGCGLIVNTALTGTKRAINHTLKGLALATFEFGVSLETQSQLTHDHAEAVQAFIDKRAPVWTGR